MVPDPEKQEELLPASVEEDEASEAVAPTAEGQRAEAGREDLEDVTTAATAEFRERMMKEVDSVDTFFDESGVFDLEKAKQVADFIPVETLSKLEDRHPGALLEIFTEKIDDKTFEVNFRGNGYAEKLIGLSWLLKHKPGIRAVEITYPPEKGGHTRTGHRQGLKGSFYDSEGYVEVLNGYKVSVSRELDEDSRAIRRMQERVDTTIAEFDENKDDPRFKEFMVMLSDEKYSSIAEEPADVAKQVVEAAANYGTDPYFVMALLKTENGNGGKFFGVLQEGAIGFGIQLELALRNIREYEVNYRALSGKKASKNGVYTAEFLSYFSEIYAPSAQNANHFNNLHRIYFKYRGESVPELGDDVAEGRKLADSYRNGLSLASHVRRPVTREQISATLKGGVNMRELVPAMTRFSSEFGMRTHPIEGVRKMHPGIDIAAPQGTPCNSWRAGKVTFAGPMGSYGNVVFVKHPDGSESRYAHLYSLNVRKGDSVEKGGQVGTIGSTGMSTGPHLHFEIRINGQPINPLEQNE